MWSRLASILIRHRLPAVLTLAALTVFMGLQIPNLKMQYKYGGILPEDDPAELAHARFLESFGAEGNVLVIGVEDEQLRTGDGLMAWHELAEEIRALRVTVDGAPAVIIDSVFALTHAFEVSKHPVEKRFELIPVARELVEGMPNAPPLSDKRASEIVDKVRSLPFYDGLLYNLNNEATLMMVVFNHDMLNSAQRGTIVEDIIEVSDRWSETHDITTHLSGLPFIRISMTNKVKGEIGYFIGAAILVTALLLMLFFRNLAVVGVCMAVVAVGVTWSLGSIALFDFRVSLLMSLIPPLMIVIGVPNCIYLVNKYQAEFKRHGNKMMALQRMVTKVGNATLLTNATTAFGFATFIFTHSPVLIEFGVVAALNIMVAFGISIVLIPALFTWLPEPTEHHLTHLDRVWVDRVVGTFVRAVQEDRTRVYFAALVVFAMSAWGMTQMQTTGNIVDDLPKEDRVLTDLSWLEDRFKGVMPFEVLVDGQKPGQILSAGNLRRIEKFQNLLREYPEFSRSLSAVDAVKFGVQAFYGGDPDRYRLPNRQERSFMGPYFRGSESAASDVDDATSVTANFVDSSKTVTRISANMADVGTLEMEALMAELRPRMDSIFPPERYDLTITGHKHRVSGRDELPGEEFGHFHDAGHPGHRRGHGPVVQERPNGGHCLDSQPASAVVHGGGDGLDRHSHQAVDHLGLQRRLRHLGGRHHSLFGQIQARAPGQRLEHPQRGAGGGEGNRREHDVHVDRAVLRFHDVRHERIRRHALVGHFGLGDPLGGDVHQPHAAPVSAHELCPVRDHQDVQRAVFRPARRGGGLGHAGPSSPKRHKPWEGRRTA